MEQQDYKNEIRSSRCGALGSSDGKLILQVAESGVIPKSAYKRLAVCRGLIEQEDIPYTAAVRAGDELEMLVFEHLKANDDRYQSNPCWVSKKYSRKNVKLLTHPDIVLQDDENKVLNVYEVKCTKFTFEQTRDTYKAQLIIHWIIANEIAKELGGYKVRLSLVHYSTDGMNLEDGFEFDPSRLTVKQLRNIEKEANTYRLSDAMDILNDFLETFTEYYEDEEIDGNLLPEKVKAEFDQVTTFLTEIKEREKKVEDFKKKLTEFMISKGVKSIKNDAWAITLVNESESVSVDYKAIFANEIEAKKPRVANKLKKQYKKVTKKKAYVMIKTKDNNNE
jgi:hypothetical protein